MDDWQKIQDHLSPNSSTIPSNQLAIDFDMECLLGQQVRVGSGVLCGVIGTVVSVDSDGRAILSVATDGTPIRVEINRDVLQWAI